MTIETHIAQQVEAKLLEPEGQALDATRRADGEFYARYLADDTVAILPNGVFDKEAVVAAMSSADNSMRSTGVSEVRAIAFGADCGLVTYRASYPTGDVLVSSLYLDRDGTWRGDFHQQTPRRLFGAALTLS